MGCGAPVTPAAKRTATAAAAAVVLAAAHLWWAVLAVAAVAVGVWVFRLRRHPMGPCRSCKGRAGRNLGSDRTQWGKCPRCLKTPGGLGEEPRLGAQLVHPELRRKRV